MQCTLCVTVVDLLFICGNTSILTPICSKLVIEVINRNGPLTITVDFLKIETVV